MSHRPSLSDYGDHPPIISARAAQTGPAVLLPSVTVIAPAFNEAATILDTLQSLLHQTIAPTQIIVVDDCSNRRHRRSDVAVRCHGIAAARQ